MSILAFLYHDQLQGLSFPVPRFIAHVGLVVPPFKLETF